MLEIALSNSATPQTAPVVKGLPFIGPLMSLIRNPFGFMSRAREQYGDVYTVDFGFLQATVFNHPQHAQHILRDNAANYSKGGPLWDSVRALLGNGLVVSEGNFWLRQRRLMQPQFHRQRLAALTDLMVSAIDESLQSWAMAADSDKPANMAPRFNQLTMNVIVKTLFGTGLSGEEVTTVSQSMEFALDFVLKGVMAQSLPTWFPFPGRNKFKKAIADYDKVVYRMIQECRQGHQDKHHLLAMLLDTVDEETGEQMSDQQLRDEVATLFLAGFETTAIVLSWAFALLAQHPDILAKLKAEVDTVLGKRQPTFQDLPNMPYSRMVLQEVMRLRPPSWWLPRTAVADDEVDGYHIPAGTQVVSLTYMYHNHPDSWENPEQFDPERFQPDQVAKRHKYAWVPFGAGQRLCIGRDFALMEGQLALVMALQQYDIAPAGTQLPQPMLSSTLRPKGGVQVYLRKR